MYPTIPRRLQGALAAATLVIAAACSSTAGTEVDAGAATGDADPTTTMTAGTDDTSGPDPADPGPGVPLADTDAARALAFSAVDLDGEVVEGRDLLGSDLVVWFWAPWCTSCNQNAPAVATVAQALGDQVTFLGVAGLDGAGPSRDFVARHGLDGFRHLHDDGTVWGGFGITVQSTFAFVNDDGTVEVTSKGVLSESALTERVQALIDG